MIQLSYASSASLPITAAGLLTILQQCYRHNPLQDVTGLLLYGNGTFLQALEGDEAVVAKLYETIASDPRHCNVTCLSRKTIDARAFPGWNMGFRRLVGPSSIGSTSFARADVREALLANFDVASGLRPKVTSVSESEQALAKLTEALRRAEGALEIARLALEDVVEAHDAGNIGDTHGKVCRFALGQVNAIRGARTSVTSSA